MNKNRDALKLCQRVGMLVPMAQMKTSVRSAASLKGKAQPGIVIQAPKSPVRAIAIAAVSTFSVGMMSPAWAGNIINCNNGSGYMSAYGAGYNGQWVANSNCPGTGVTIYEGAGGVVPAQITIGYVGGVGSIGALTLIGPSGISLQGVTSLNNNKIELLAAGTAATDAVNFGQLSSLSTSTFNSLGSLSTGLANAVSYDDASHSVATLGSVGATAPVRLTNVASGVNPTDAVNFSQLSSLSTTTSTGLSTAQSGISSLSTGLSSTTSELATLSSSQTRYVSVNDGGTQQGNYLNTGATGLGAIAIGPGASASADGSIALGQNAVANVANSVALGANSQTAAAAPVSNATVGGIAYGGFAGATPVGVVSVGSVGAERQITNVAAGQVSGGSTDAVNGSQLFSVANVVGSLSTSVSTTLSTVYTDIASTNDNVNSLSTSLSTTNDNVSSLSTSVSSSGGGGSSNNGDKTSNGSGSNASGDSSTANGSGSNASGDKSTATGSGSTASGTESTATGSGSLASGNGSTANGANAVASGVNSKADGYSSTASGDGSTALGAQANASGANSVALGAGSVANEPNTVSVGSPGNERRITNVGPGVAGTDAVNMNQLQGVQSGVNAVARNAYSGIAAATALTMIPEVDQGKTIAVGIGGGMYQGYSAGALGISARITQNIKVKAGVGISSAAQTYGAGVSYQW